MICREPTQRFSLSAPPLSHAHFPSISLKQINDVQNGAISPVSQRVGFLRSMKQLWVWANGNIHWLPQRVGQQETCILLLEREGPVWYMMCPADTDPQLNSLGRLSLHWPIGPAMLPGPNPKSRLSFRHWKPEA